MLDHVIDAAKSAQRYLSQHSEKTRALTSIAVLCPTGDPIAKEFSNLIHIVEGPEHDVLQRYLIAAAEFRANYIVRVTGDCPLIPAWLISKVAKIAVTNRYDYVSNVDERARTFLDGADCEVISRRLLEHCGQFAKEASDREHVTTFARREPPEWCKSGAVVGHFDHSWQKLSVDTPDDLVRVRKEFAQTDEKYQRACEIYGKKAVHRV